MSIMAGCCNAGKAGMLRQRAVMQDAEFTMFIEGWAKEHGARRKMAGLCPDDAGDAEEELLEQQNTQR